MEGAPGVKPKTKEVSQSRINAQATAHITFKLFKRALQVA